MAEEKKSGPPFTNEENNERKETDEEKEEELKELKAKPKPSFVNRFWTTIAVTSGLMQALAMAVNRSIFVYVSGGIGLCVAPIAALRQRALAREEGIRDIQRKLSKEVGRLTAENEKLTNSVDELEQTVGQLKEVEEELDGIAQTQGKNVGQLVDLVNENGKVLTEMKEVLTAELCQNITSIVLRSDRDGDLRISDKEIKILFLRLKNFEGVIINEKLLRERLKQNSDGTTLRGFLKFIRRMVDEDVPDDQKVFNLKPEMLRKK